MSVEKELGALQEGLKNISAQLDKAEVGRKNMYERLEGMDRKLDHLDWRVVAMEKRLTDMDPTIAKVERIQIQAEGVSKLGVFASRVGFVLLSIGSGIAGAWATVAGYFKWNM